MNHSTMPPITCFRDALGFAMELSERYAIVNAAALLGGDGRPIDLAVVDGLGTSIEPVVAWAGGIDRWVLDPRSVLLVSVRPIAPDIVEEADIRRFRHARWSLAGAGCDLADWIETDGDLFRSYAYLVAPDLAWIDDPPQHRATDGHADGGWPW